MLNDKRSKACISRYDNGAYSRMQFLWATPYHSSDEDERYEATDVPFGLPLITCVRLPRTHNSFGDRSFGADGPRIWNSLSRGLRTLDISYKHFKALLKTYMFRQGHSHGALW